MAYGQTGSNDSTIVNAGAAATTAVQTNFGSDWWIRHQHGYPRHHRAKVALHRVRGAADSRAHGGPHRCAALRRRRRPTSLATYATGDFAGLNVVSTITPNVKLNFTYVQVEEMLSGCRTSAAFPNCNSNTASPTVGGIGYSQLRGDDFAIIVAPRSRRSRASISSRCTRTSTRAARPAPAPRMGRGGVNTTTAFTNADGSWRPGSTRTAIRSVSMAAVRLGPFSLDPTIMYQFGNRDVVVPGMPGECVLRPTAQNCLALASGKAPGSLAKADISAWLFDVRAGFQIGPLLIEGMYIVHLGQQGPGHDVEQCLLLPAADDRHGLPGRLGDPALALGLDYLNALNGERWPHRATKAWRIGWDKYGRHQASVKASYFLTPNLSGMGGVAVHLTHRAIDTNGITQNSAGRRRRWRSPPRVRDRQAGR